MQTAAQHGVFITLPGGQNGFSSAVYTCMHLHNVDFEFYFRLRFEM